MYSFKSKIRVRYSDTDQMGFVYYGVYAQYFEVGRVEFFRSLSISYKELEMKGFSFPVVHMNVDYKKPAFYDDIIIVNTSVNKISSVRINFSYETLNLQNDILNTAEVILVCYDKKNKKACAIPDYIINKIKKIVK
tara:strand:- start:215 stop:622 length:408 start_codon:yes stop_codon:yes gene_type:complete